MRWIRLAAGLLLALALGACAESETTATPAPATASAAPTATAAAGAVRTESHEQFGTILVDAQGRSLYTFDNDTSTSIACTGMCATRWPPLISSETTGVAGLGTRKRPDGTTQLTYKDKPLYRFSGDTKAGDTNGEGVGGVWHIAKVTA